MPSNVAFTAAALKLAHDEWDYTAPTPQVFGAYYYCYCYCYYYYY